MMCWSLAQFSVLYPSSFESKLRAGLLETFQEFLRELALEPQSTYAPGVNKQFFTISCHYQIDLRKLSKEPTKLGTFLEKWYISKKIINGLLKVS